MHCIPTKIQVEANNHGSNISSLLVKQLFFSMCGYMAGPGGTFEESTLCQNANESLAIRRPKFFISYPLSWARRKAVR